MGHTTERGECAGKSSRRQGNCHDRRAPILGISRRAYVNAESVKEARPSGNIHCPTVDDVKEALRKRDQNAGVRPALKKAREIIRIRTTFNDNPAVSVD